MVGLVRREAGLPFLLELLPTSDAPSPVRTRVVVDVERLERRVAEVLLRGLDLGGAER